MPVSRCCLTKHYSDDKLMFPKLLYRFFVYAMDILSPIVYWGQSKNAIFLKIDLREVVV